MNNSYLMLYKVANGYVLEKPTEPAQAKNNDDVWVFKTLDDMKSHLHSYYNDDGMNGG
jgi:hypothetical protein